MKSLLSLSFSLLCHVLFSQKVAITFDDLPFVGGQMGPHKQVEAFGRIMAALENYEVEPTGFITTGNITEIKKEILDQAKLSGWQLGNHTHNHFNLNAISAKRYIEDISVCEELAGDWLNSDYFRYSMLHRGNTREKRDSVYAYLESKGYKIAPVTIDNDEWIYNRDYRRALEADDKKAMDSIGTAFLKHMKEVSIKYQKLGVEIMDREVSHILLLHANPLNADYLAPLLEWYVEERWEFISLDEAMEDDFYRLQDDYVGPHGFSQLDRIKRVKVKPE